MRVIGGTWRGRKLVAVPGKQTRPTSDRVREALFSRIESRFGLDEAAVLDLFAGTGALGIEALSRGAASLVAVERSRGAARVVLENLGSLGAKGRAEVRVLEVARALAELAAEGRRFEGVFIDPPYAGDLGLATLELLAELEPLAPGAFVSVESSREAAFPERCGRLLRIREDNYGDTKVTLYEWAAGGE